MEEDFDFDDIEDHNYKKSKNKGVINSNKTKKNHNQSDIFDELQNQSPKVKNQNKRNSYQFTDELMQKQQNFAQHNKNNPKQSTSILPPINVIKPGEIPVEKKKQKMDLTLQQLKTDNKNMINSESKVKKSPKNFQVNYEFINDQENSQKNQIKNHRAEIINKQNQYPIKKNKNNHTKEQNIAEKSFTQQTNHFQQIEKSKNKSQKSQSNQDSQKQQIYQEEFEDEHQKQILQKKLLTNLKKSQKIEQKKQSLNKNRQIDSKNTVRTSKIKKQSEEGPINKFKELVEKSFPDDHSAEKLEKMKPETVNRINDKMRDMIKGFSSELTALIDKNLNLLSKPENQIKEEIQGEDPIESQINLLGETKNNNIKMLDITEKQLQSVTKMIEKMQQSGEYNIQLQQQIEFNKEQIALVNRQISNMRNDVEKQGKKVIKIQSDSRNSSEKGIKGSGNKTNLQVRQKFTIATIESDKNTKKINELEAKCESLEIKINEINEKKKQILQKAQQQGISFYTKDQKKKYEELKKKRQQLVSFASKFNTSIKSKQTLIQHQMTDIQTLIYDLEQRYQKVQNSCQSAKQKMLDEIKKGKSNKKLPINTRDVLEKLQQFMIEGNQHEEKAVSLNLISEKIYNREYKGQNKNKTQQKQSKKQIRVKPKDYLHQIARTQQQIKNKKQLSQQKNQNNPLKNQTKQNRQSLQGKPNQYEIQRQKQRIWQESQTLNIKDTRNKATSQMFNGRYDKKINEQDNPLNNQQLMKLIDKNKEKIVLKQRPIKQTNTQTSNNQKPFSFRSSLKQKEIKIQLNDNNDDKSHIPKEQQKIVLNTVPLKNQHTEKQQNLISLKLFDQKTQLKIQGQEHTSESKINKSPFLNIRLKKSNSPSPITDQILSEYKLQSQLIQQDTLKALEKKSLKQQQPVEEDLTNIRPKRFNLRKRNEESQQSYQMSSSPQIHSKNEILSKPASLVKNNEEKKQPEGYNPFANFLNKVNKQENSFKITQSPQQTKKLTLNDEPKQNIENVIKPRLNLFKRSNQSQQKQKKQQPAQFLKIEKKQEPIISKAVQNPYNQQINSESIPTIKRQNRLKKNKPEISTQLKNNNIYDNVEDITSNNKILQMNEPTHTHTYNIKNNNIQSDKQPKLSDLLGIKTNKINDFDKDLLIDLPKNNPEKKIIINKNKAKNADFFNDLEI